MTGRVFRPFAWGTLTTDSTMFVSHPPSWKIMPFAQTQMALNHFKPSRNSGFVVFSVSDGVSGCKFTTSTQLEQIPRAYWILLDPMMRYGDIDVSPLFWGSEVGDAWERWTAGRRSLHADPVSWKNGFGWLWDILNEDVMLHIHAHTCTYMGHGSTWMYMDVHGCTWKLSKPHVRVPGDVDARLENTTCNLREQRRLFSIRNQMLRYCGKSYDLTIWQMKLLFFSSPLIFFPDVPCKSFFQDTFGWIPKSSR